MRTPERKRIRIHRAPEVEPLVVSPKIAEQLLNDSHSRLYQRIKTGELESYVDGRVRRITMRSIKAAIERKLAESTA